MDVLFIYHSNATLRPSVYRTLHNVQARQPRTQPLQAHAVLCLANQQSLAYLADVFQ